MGGPISRLDFFKAAWLEVGSYAADVCDGYAGAVSSACKAANAAAARPSVVRPPGAAPGFDFRSVCGGCLDCVKACPHWVIKKAGPELGAALSGTPIISPKDNPCLFCEGLPCAAACQKGALRSPALGAATRIGTAVVDSKRCYMGQGQPCDYCMVRCPTRPRAIHAMTPGEPAVVKIDDCTGCGICAQICPTGAITIEAAS